MLRNLGITDTCIAQGHQAMFLGDGGQGGQCGWAFTYLAKLSAERSQLLATLRKRKQKSQSTIEVKRVQEEDKNSKEESMSNHSFVLFFGLPLNQQCTVSDTIFV